MEVIDQKYFGVVQWVREDIMDALVERDIEPTPENIEAVFTACNNDHHFTDEMIRAGWSSLDAKICDLLENGELEPGLIGLQPESLDSLVDMLNEED